MNIRNANLPNADLKGFSAMIHIDSADERKIVSSGTWYAWLNKDGVTLSIHFSDAIRHMLGYESKEEFPDTAECWMEHVHPDERKMVEYGAMAVCSGKTDAFDIEYRVRRKTGEYSLRCREFDRAEGGIPGGASEAGSDSLPDRRTV